MAKKRTAVRHGSTPHYALQAAATILGAVVGFYVGTLDWIQEPISGLGLGWTLVISIVLLLLGAISMDSATNFPREEYYPGSYVTLFCGIVFVSLAGCLVLGALEPFRL